MTPEQEALYDEGRALSRQATDCCCHAPAHWSEAEALWRQTLAKFEAIWGPDHINLTQTLGNLASSVSALRRPKEAEQIWRRILFLAQKGLMPPGSESLQHVHDTTFALNGYISFLCWHRRKWRARRVAKVLRAFQIQEIGKSVYSEEKKQEAIRHFCCPRH